MRTFTEYRQGRELIDLCAQYSIDLSPLAAECERLALEMDLSDEQVYQEFLNRAASMAGNLAGRAVTGVGNVARSFGQGWQQGRAANRQQPSPQEQQQPAAQQVSPQAMNGNGVEGQQKPAEALQMAMIRLQMLQRNIRDLTGFMQKEAGLIDQISQMVRQVLTQQHGITKLPQWQI